MNAASQRRLTPILVAGLIVFGGLWLLLLAGRGSNVDWSAASPSVAAPVADHSAPLPPPVPLNQFAVIWQQPLFHPDRRPVAQSGDNASIGELELTGVILTPTLQIALMHDRQGDRQVRLHQGEKLSGGNITLVEVKPRSAIFDTGNGRVELHLPAGAPIDIRTPRPGEPAPVPPRNPPLPPAVEAPPTRGRAPPNTQTQRVRALREVIKDRRAAQATAIHEGEH